MARHSRLFSSDRRTAFAAVACAAAVVGAVATEHLQFGLGTPGLWVPDFVAGTSLVVAGLFAARRDRGTGWLLVGSGAAWFIGNLFSPALYWHRGPLLHATATYRGWRPRRFIDLGFVAFAYGVAAVLAVGRSDRWNVVIGGALLTVVSVNALVASGRHRRDKRLALAAGGLLALALTGGALVRSASADPDAWSAAAHGYELCVIAAASLLAWGTRPPDVAAIADLVVDLGETRSTTLRDTVARVLGDPSLEIGFADDHGEFHGAAGERVAPPPPGSGRVATFIGGETPFAVLVHDRMVLRDDALIDAVAVVAGLSRNHETLMRAVRAQFDDVAASRHRLVDAATDELRLLEARVRAGPEPQIRSIERALMNLRQLDGDRPVPAPSHIDRAWEHAGLVVADLREICRGVYPVGLATGLPAALREMVERAPIDVHLTVDPELRPPDGISATAYFVCAEALSNVVKHARALAANVELTVSGRVLTITVADDGVGGADAARGTGIRGIADRVEALGGRVMVDSAPSVGTRLVAELPLGDQDTVDM